MQFELTPRRGELEKETASKEREEEEEVEKEEESEEPKEAKAADREGRKGGMEEVLGGDGGRGD